MQASTKLFKICPVWLLATNSAWHTNDRILLFLFLLLHLVFISPSFLVDLVVPIPFQQQPFVSRIIGKSLALKSQLTRNVSALLRRRKWQKRGEKLKELKDKSKVWKRRAKEGDVRGGCERKGGGGEGEDRKAEGNPSSFRGEGSLQSVFK